MAPGNNFALKSPLAIFAADTPDLDPFRRRRVSTPFTLFDSKLLVDKAPLVWDEVISGAGASSTYTVPQVSMAVTNNNEYVIRQTKVRFNYQPGKGQLIFQTGVLNPVSGTEKQVGYFSSTTVAPYASNYDGLYFSAIGTTLNVNQAKGGSVTAVARSSWNKDKLDGTGPSGKTLDLTKSQLAFIDFEWLGVGGVRFGFIIDRVLIVCHEFENANSLAGAYMNSPNQPLRWELRSTGSAGTLVQICGSAMSEGGLEANGLVFSTDTGNTQLDANTAGTNYALIGTRLKTTHPMANIIFSEISLLGTTINDVFRWAMILNPTVAGAFTYADITNSALQRALGATANTVTGGTVLASGYAAQQTSLLVNVRTAVSLGTAIDGTVDTIVLCIMPVAASSNLDIYGSLSWRELL